MMKNNIFVCKTSQSIEPDDDDQIDPKDTKKIIILLNIITKVIEFILNLFFKK